MMLMMLLMMLIWSLGVFSPKVQVGLHDALGRVVADVDAEHVDEVVV